MTHPKPSTPPDNPVWPRPVAVAERREPHPVDPRPSRQPDSRAPSLARTAVWDVALAVTVAAAIAAASTVPLIWW